MASADYDDDAASREKHRLMDGRRVTTKEEVVRHPEQL